MSRWLVAFALVAACDKRKAPPPLEQPVEEPATAPDRMTLAADEVYAALLRGEAITIPDFGTFSLFSDGTYVGTDKSPGKLVARRRKRWPTFKIDPVAQAYIDGGNAPATPWVKALIDRARKGNYAAFGRVCGFYLMSDLSKLDFDRTHQIEDELDGKTVGYVDTAVVDLALSSLPSRPMYSMDDLDATFRELGLDYKTLGLLEPSERATYSESGLIGLQTSDYQQRWYYDGKDVYMYDKTRKFVFADWASDVVTISSIQKAARGRYLRGADAQRVLDRWRTWTFVLNDVPY